MPKPRKYEKQMPSQENQETLAHAFFENEIFLPISCIISTLADLSSPGNAFSKIFSISAYAMYKVMLSAERKDKIYKLTEPLIYRILIAGFFFTSLYFFMLYQGSYLIYNESQFQKTPVAHLYNLLSSYIGLLSFIPNIGRAYKIISVQMLLNLVFFNSPLKMLSWGVVVHNDLFFRRIAQSNLFPELTHTNGIAIAKTKALLEKVGIKFIVEGNYLSIFPGFPFSAGETLMNKMENLRKEMGRYEKRVANIVTLVNTLHTHGIACSFSKVEKDDVITPSIHFTSVNYSEFPDSLPGGCTLLQGRYPHILFDLSRYHPTENNTLLTLLRDIQSKKDEAEVAARSTKRSPSPEKTPFFVLTKDKPVIQKPKRTKATLGDSTSSSDDISATLLPEKVIFNNGMEYPPPPGADYTIYPLHGHGEGSNPIAEVTDPTGQKTKIYTTQFGIFQPIKKSPNPISEKTHQSCIETGKMVFCEDSKLYKTHPNGHGIGDERYFATTKISGQAGDTATTLHVFDTLRHH